MHSLTAWGTAAPLGSGFFSPTHKDHPVPKKQPRCSSVSQINNPASLQAMESLQQRLFGLKIQNVVSCSLLPLLPAARDTSNSINQKLYCAMNCVNILNLRFPRAPFKILVFFNNKKTQTKKPATNSHLQQNTLAISPAGKPGKSIF